MSSTETKDTDISATSTLAMTSSALGIFVVLGLIESSWAPIIPFIKERFALGEGALGMLLLCTGVGSFCALPAVSLCVSRLGVRNTAAVSLVLMGLTLIGISLSPWPAACAAALLLFGALTIGLDVSANVNAVLVEETLGRHLMSGFHAGYSAGTLAGSMLMSSVLAIGVWLGLAAALMAALGWAIGLWCCRWLFKSSAQPEHETPAAADGKSPQSRLPRAIVLIGVMCFIAYSTEGAVMGWSGVLSSQEYGVSLSHAGFTYVAFAIAMTLARFAGNRLVDRFGRRTVVVSGSVLMACGLWLSVCSAFLPLLLTGFFIIGVGAANIVPQLVSYTGVFRHISIPRAITFINAFGYSGILAGPVVIGYLAEIFGLRTVFAGMGVMTLAITLLSLKVIRS